MDYEFKELNEQLKIWNSKIDTSNKNISTAANCISTVPNQVTEVEDQNKNRNVLKQKLLRIEDTMPILIFQDVSKFTPTMRFDAENKVADIFEGKNTVYKTGNIFLPSNITSVRFINGGKELFAAGNSFLYGFNVETRQRIVFWCAMSRSAPNYVLDFDWNDGKSIMLMKDGFIRIFSKERSSITLEFPPFIECASFVRLLNKSVVVVANDQGDVTVQLLECVFSEPSFVGNVKEKPLECTLNGSILTITTNNYTCTVNLEEQTISFNDRTVREQYSLGYEEKSLIVTRNGKSQGIELDNCEISCVALQDLGRKELIAVGNTEGCLSFFEIHKNNFNLIKNE